MVVTELFTSQREELKRIVDDRGGDVVNSENKRLLKSLAFHTRDKRFLFFFPVLGYSVFKDIQ